MNIYFSFGAPNVYLDRERTKKTSCEATFERHYFVYQEKWYNTVINEYNVRTDVRTTKFSWLDGLPYFLKYGGSACAFSRWRSESAINLNHSQQHPTDRFGGISVQKTCNRLKFSVREMSSRAFLIDAFCFRRDKNDVLGTKILRSARVFGKAIRPKVFGKWTKNP